MTDKEIENALNYLTKKVIVLEATTLQNALLLAGIFKVLSAELKIDIDKLLADLQTPENVKYQIETQEKLTKTLEEMLKNANHGGN